MKHISYKEEKQDNMKTPWISRITYHYHCYFLEIIASSISYIVTKYHTLSTSSTMSYNHLHFQVAKSCVALVNHLFTRIEDRYCCFLFKRQRMNKIRKPNYRIFRLSNRNHVPCHQGATEKRHANHNEETSEPIVHDQLRGQLIISSSQKKPEGKHIYYYQQNNNLLL